MIDRWRKWYLFKLTCAQIDLKQTDVDEVRKQSLEITRKDQMMLWRLATNAFTYKHVCGRNNMFDNR